MAIKLNKILLLLCIFTLVSCGTTPITGRRHLKLIPNQTLMSLSFNEYKTYISQNKLSKNYNNTQLVKNVGTRIQRAVELYFKERNESHLLDGYQWEYNVIADKTINAFCMPGGKVAFYEGILDYTKNTDGIAVVMGHEIAHAIADHGNSRMSQALLVQLGGLAVDQYLQKYPEETRTLFLAAYGATAQVGVMLPYSRKQEYEADYIGLVIMSMAGYNPNESVKFWERMSKANKGTKLPQFLSTHPLEESRIKHLKTKIPEAMKYYNKYKNK